MAISGTSCSTCSSSYLSVKDTNNLRQQENTQNTDSVLSDEQSSKQEPAEFIFRGELLEEANQNNGFREKRDQTIAPANQSAINSYEDNSFPTESLAFKQQGNILDAYA